MSFLRHKQIYRPMLLTSKRDSFTTVPLSSSDGVCDRLFLGELHSCSARLRFTGYCHPEADSRKPSTTTHSGLGNFHPAKWGFFNRR
jgi:hypothetical protein